jgi:hypothetical protein
LLLKAALLAEDEAAAAWSEWDESTWRAVLDAAHLDMASFRTLPLVNRNLSGHPALAGSEGILRGIYRRSWVANQMIQRAAGEAIEILQASAIDVLVLKGLALALSYYDEASQRPMADFDLLVHIDSAVDAIAILQEAGWRPASRYTFTADSLEERSALLLMSDDGDQLDLHWSAFQQARHPIADADLWERSEPLEVGHVPTSTLCPAHQLVQVVAHGSLWNTVPTIRWVPDVMMLLRNSEVDWDEVVTQSGMRETTLLLGRALLYLKSVFDAPVPAEVLATLKSAPVTRGERARHWANSHWTPGKMGTHFFQYLQLARRRGERRPSLRGYLKYQGQMWATPTPRDFGAKLTQHTGRSFRRLLGRRDA